MQLILIRGLPGSGKSTLARSMLQPDCVHFEADMFFVGDDGCYHYNAKKIKEAHAWCQEETHKALQAGKRVVVSNTFTQLWEMVPYFEMANALGIKPAVLETKGNWQNVHNVPVEVINKMRERWEEM